VKLVLNSVACLTFPSLGGRARAPETSTGQSSQVVHCPSPLVEGGPGEMMSGRRSCKGPRWGPGLSGLGRGQQFNAGAVASASAQSSRRFVRGEGGLPLRLEGHTRGLLLIRTFPHHRRPMPRLDPPTGAGHVERHKLKDSVKKRIDGMVPFLVVFVRPVVPPEEPEPGFSPDFLGLTDDRQHDYVQLTR